MKKVWVLERFNSKEDMLATLERMKDLAKETFESGEFSQHELDTANEAVEKLAKAIEENPEGRWLGWEGRTNYKAFCEVARNAIRRAKKDWKFRVVEALIPDNSESWMGYEMLNVNDGVLRYLMATK